MTRKSLPLHAQHIIHVQLITQSGIGTRRYPRLHARYTFADAPSRRGIHGKSLCVRASAAAIARNGTASAIDPDRAQVFATARIF